MGFTAVRRNSIGKEVGFTVAERYALVTESRKIAADRHPVAETEEVESEASNIVILRESTGIICAS